MKRWIAFLVVAGFFGVNSSAFAQGGAPDTLQNIAGFAEYLDQSMTRVAAIRQDIQTNGYGTKLDDLAKVYGQKPMRSIAYLTNVSGEVGRSIMTAAARTGVDPNFLAVAMFQEGFNMVVEKANQQVADGTYKPGKMVIDGFYDIGVDSFASQVKGLKARKYLRGDYNGIRLTGETWTNEVNDKFPAYEFTGMTNAAEAVAAILAMSRDRFLADARALGIDTGAMTEEQRDQWTYLYYNSGIGTGKRLLTQSKGKMPKAREANSRNAYFNAGRVGASVALYRQYGVFAPFGNNSDRNQQTNPVAPQTANPGGAGTAR